MKTESEKCAEVYRNGPGKFTFVCTYCTEQFEWHYEALEHVESHFPFDENIKTNVEIQPENLDTEKMISLSTVFVPANKDYFINDTNIESVSYTTKKYALQNEFPQSVLEDPISYDSNCLDTIKVEPTENKTSIKSKTTPIKTSPKQRKPSKKSPEINKYAKFGKFSPTDFVECDICKDRKRRKHMLSHMRVHANLKQFVCTICQNRYNLKRALNTHMRQTHSGLPKQYCCQYCSHRFHDLSNLKHHIYIHTGEKPFKCETCGKAFTHQSSLKGHIRIHTEEKPYQCKICNKSFKNNSSYLEHKRRHAQIKNYKCNTCDKAFVNNNSLRKHSLIHTGERPFSCNTCDAKFSSRFSFNQHLILHTNEKPYKCRFCDKPFSQLATRRLHERSIHNDIKRCSAL